MFWRADFALMGRELLAFEAVTHRRGRIADLGLRLSACAVCGVQRYEEQRCPCQDSNEQIECRFRTHEMWRGEVDFIKEPQLLIG